MIENINANNHEKQSAYARLKKRLKIALSYGFWFEACMIEYAIIEDRTRSILYYAGIVKDASSKKLENKLNSIEHQIGKKHPIIYKKVSPENISAIRKWKEVRNTITHKIFNNPYDEELIKELAIEGEKLVDKISNDAKKVKRLAIKIDNENNSLG